MASMAKRRRKENVAEPTPKITWKEIKRQKVLIFWSLIIVIYGIIFYYLPLGGWVMAFEDYKPKDGLFHSAFVGLANFKQLFSDVTFVRVIRNTLAMGVINLAATFIMAIVFAILLNEVQSKGGKKVVQTISYLPHFLSWIIVTGILHDALSSTGIVNELLAGYPLPQGHWRWCNEEYLALLQTDAGEKPLQLLGGLLRAVPLEQIVGPQHDNQQISVSRKL